MPYQRYIVGILALIGSVFIGWLALFRPNWLMAYTLFNFAFSLVLLMFFISPAGSVTLGKEPRYSFFKWLGKLLVGQGILFIFSVAAFVAIFNQGPGYVDPVTLSFAKNTISDYTRWMWGIFPWALYGFWGLIIAYIVYVKKGQPYFYQIARGFFQKRFDPMIKSYVEGSVNGATMFALSMVACAIALLFSYGIETYFHLQHFEVPSITYMILSFFMFFISIKKGRALFKRLTIRSRSYILFYSFMIIVLTFLLVMCGYANAWVVKAHPEFAKIQCVECRQYFMRVPIEVRFASIYWGWWFIWAPLAGSYVASISQGRTIREFVLGIFFVPIIIGLIHFCGGDAIYLAIWQVIKSSYALIFASGEDNSANWSLAMMYITLGLLSCSLFMMMLKPFRDSTLFSSGYMSASSQVKENRLWLQDASKSKGISKIAQKLALLMMGTIFVQTISGWYGVQLELLAMGVLVLNIAYSGFHLIVLRCLFDRTWLGNQNIKSY